MTKNNLEIQTRSRALLNKVYPSLMNYPRYEHHIMCEDIRYSFYGLLRSIALVDKVRSQRKRYAQKADGYLENIRILMTLSRDLEHISLPFFREIDMELSLIGQMIGAYIRAI